MANISITFFEKESSTYIKCIDFIYLFIFAISSFVKSLYTFETTPCFCPLCPNCLKIGIKYYVKIYHFGARDMVQSVNVLVAQAGGPGFGFPGPGERLGVAAVSLAAEVGTGGSLELAD